MCLGCCPAERRDSGPCRALLPVSEVVPRRAAIIGNGWSADMDSAIMLGMDDRSRFLAAYDEQLRTNAETQSAVAVRVLGPVWLVTFAGGRGFVTYQDLGGADADGIRRLVEAGLAHFQANPEITQVEWKTRAHDHAPGLQQSLLGHGFVAEAPESIMIGAAQRLAVDVPLPDGVTLRQITEDCDVRAMTAVRAQAFGDSVAERGGHGRCLAAPARSR